MTEETEGSSTAPGSGAGDAAPTQAIPRIPKPPAAKKSPTKKSPTKKAAAAGQTDKGRPRPATPPAGQPAAEQPAVEKPVVEKPLGGPTGRPLTAADYARTTKTSAASTAVIPAVKEKIKKVKDQIVDSTTSPSLTPASTGGSGRRASLRLTHVEPWSVTRIAFAISVAMMVVAVVAAAIFWVVLDFVGVWNQINDSFTSVLSDNSSSFDVKDYFGFGRVVGLTLVLSAVNVVITTALATIAAHLYNLAAQLMGGVEVTFAEEK